MEGPDRRGREPLPCSSRLRAPRLELCRSTGDRFDTAPVIVQQSSRRDRPAASAPNEFPTFKGPFTSPRLK